MCNISNNSFKGNLIRSGTLHPCCLYRSSGSTEARTFQIWICGWRILFRGCTENTLPPPHPSFPTMTNRPLKPLDGLHAKRWTNPTAKSISHIARSWLERQIVTLPLIYQGPPISANRLNSSPMVSHISHAFEQKEQNEIKCKLILGRFFSLRDMYKDFFPSISLSVCVVYKFSSSVSFACVPHCCKPLLQLRMYCFRTIRSTGITTYVVGK